MSQTDIPAGPVFATHAPPMRRTGFAVVPARGKEPIRKAYRKWRHAPGAETVAKWAEKDPDADIVYLPGLSQAKLGGSGIVVVDADDEPACEATRPARCAPAAGGTSCSAIPVSIRQTEQPQGVRH